MAPDVAMAGDRDAILESCARDTDLPSYVCDCIADKAPRELNGAAYSFFLATVTGDEAQEARLRATTPPQVLMTAAMFMTNAPGHCARQ